jgi:excinuclease ABC subunit C
MFASRALILESLPDSPGVYLMKDGGGKIIYVGKALSLRKRVRSYFQRYEALAPRTQGLVRSIEDIEYIATRSEMEALLLECTLIKKWRPYFNIRLKDDKRYPFLEVTYGDPFPAIRISRSISSTQSRIYGPYTNAKALRESLSIIKRMFRIRTCTLFDNGVARRPCLDAQMDLCLAPCSGEISRDEYLDQVRLACRFLEGHTEDVRRSLLMQMDAEAKHLNYEKCARIRNTIAALERILERQNVVLPEPLDEDFIAVARDDERILVMVLQVREGKLQHDQHFLLEDRLGAEPGQALAEFLAVRYDDGVFIPPRINLDVEVPDQGLLGEMLKGRRGGKVQISSPKQGERRRLLEMTRRNAFHRLERHRALLGRERIADLEGIMALQEIFSLPRIPLSIEGYDISAFQGREAVGSRVVFREGLPSKKDYRRYRISVKEAPDDYAMMEEVLRRRFSSGEDRPDLVLIDGGKGHLGAALSVLGGIEEMPVLSLAKEHEEIHYREGAEVRGPVSLPRASPALRLLQRVRDEAHRFAVSHHRTVRRRSAKLSALDSVPGVGSKRKALLVEHFGSPRRVLEADVEEIASVPGFGPNLARAVHNALRAAQDPPDR